MLAFIAWPVSAYPEPVSSSDAQAAGSSSSEAAAAPAGSPGDADSSAEDADAVADVPAGSTGDEAGPAAAGPADPATASASPADEASEPGGGESADAGDAPDAPGPTASGDAPDASAGPAASAAGPEGSDGSAPVQVHTIDSGRDEGADGSEGSSELVYEDDAIKVTAKLPEGSFFPEGVTLEARELNPSQSDERESRRFTEAMDRVAEEAGANGTQIIDARAYDISLVDESGREIEPDQGVDVSIEHKEKVRLEGAGLEEAELGVAHLMDNRQVEFVDADFVTDSKSRVQKTEFQAESFSVYVVFNGTPSTQSTKPLNTGEYGWIRFGGDIVTNVSPPGDGQSHDGWRKFLKMNVYTLTNSANAGSRNPADYALAKSFSDLSTWADGFTIEDFEFNAADVWSTYRVAHSDYVSAPQNGVAVGQWAEYCYIAGTWVDSTHIPPNGGFYADVNELNIYLGTTDTQERTTTAIITYEHADGTQTSDTTILHEGETLSVSQAGHALAGETYSGMEVTAGAGAVSNVNTANGTATVSFNAGVSQVRITIRYTQSQPQIQTTRYNITYIHADGTEEHSSGLLNVGDTYEITEAIVNARAKANESVQSTTTSNSQAVHIIDPSKGTAVITGTQGVQSVDVTVRFQSVNTTSYIVRYYHADGSFDEVDGSLRPGEQLAVDEAANRRSGETYSGVTITTGNAAVSVDPSTGSGTITGTQGVRLAKVNVYYKELVARETGGAVSGSPQYDAKQTASGKVYDTSRDGLHTDKTATLHEGGAGGADDDGRTFDLKLESWNIQQNIANIGMVLDASGSMVWPSNLPEVFQQGMSDWRALFGQNWQNKTTTGPWWNQTTTYTVLTAEQVAMVLDSANTDDSKINYNGYKYYVYDSTNAVHEHVALAYYNPATDPGYQFNTSSNNRRQGWYYVNSTDFANGTGKQLCGWNGNPVEFYVADDGSLHCRFQFAGNKDSQVFVKADDADTKSEVLQNAIARFVAALSPVSPQSEVAMTRFSSKTYANQQARLLLLNWTGDSAAITGAMNQEYGSPKDHADSHSAGGEYNYAITGGTNTYIGLETYMSRLTDNANGSYAATNSNGADSKYLIIFTDGKDSNENNGMNRARQDVARLKAAGYTVITVLMESAGMATSGDLAAAQSFLTELAGTSAGNDGADYFFSARYDEPEDLVAKFQEIALTIAKPLQDYTVRDYIDPRFDLIDSNGNVLTVLNANGGFGESLYIGPDGKRAMLKYDSDKKMFYLEWTGQDIPSTARNADEVSVWSSTITVRAKEDFLGGADMLANGNEGAQNQVFDPANPSNPHKDFPRVTVAPETLELELGNYEDTLFLGEDISSADMLAKVVQNSGGSWYLEYLKRLAAYEGKDQNAYIAQLAAQGALELEYRYLPDTYSDAQGSSYAGTQAHQSDAVGTLRYTWQADADAPTASSDKEATLSVAYDPHPFNAGPGDQFADNGSPRTRVLVGAGATAQNIPIRDWDGTASSRTGDGIAAVHAVDGRICIQKRIDKEALAYHVQHGLAPETLTFTLEREFDGQHDASYRSVEVAMPKTLAEVNALPTEGDYAVVATQWVTGLPLGTYTLVEQSPGALFEETEYSAVGYTGPDEATRPYYEAKGESNAEHFNAGFVGGNTWEIGITPVHDDRHYDNSDFARATVSDDVKQVDPAISGDDTAMAGGKAYLNAQIGMSVVVNTFQNTADFSIRKKGAQADGSFQNLEGVGFDLYTATVQGDAWTRDELVTSAQTDADGLAAFAGLGDGFYLLYETRAAPGYQLPDEPWRVTVANGAITAFTDQYGQDVSPEQGSSLLGIYVIYNNVQPNLPFAGSASMNDLLKAAALALILAALGLFIREKLLIRKRRAVDG